MSSKQKTDFLNSVPVAKMATYKKCLNAKGRPSKECAPMREEFKVFVSKAAKPALRPSPPPSPSRSRR